MKPGRVLVSLVTLAMAIAACEFKYNNPVEKCDHNCSTEVGDVGNNDGGPEDTGPGDGNPEIVNPDEMQEDCIEKMPWIVPLINVD